MNRISRVLEEEIKKENQKFSSKFFTFNGKDLKKEWRLEEKYKIVSPELRTTLNSLLDKSFSTIIFSDRKYLEIGEGSNNWIRINKKDLLNREAKNDTLSLLWTDYTLISEKQLPYNFGGADYQRGVKFSYYSTNRYRSPKIQYYSSRVNDWLSFYFTR
ncbi:MAG: hypothetical protein MRERC_6c014 [Mycoplasmataceae bacterium RC_NB112A]|nr:MAG: hypothetical protein MRERC_13c014 [Mycoplasmataceae bacterium RC_NB112A]KLL01933.1 MAG: hypothetical protein MRERC_6c014 [Mycoplasmataceae bacterium RC_NB112A]